MILTVLADLPAVPTDASGRYVAAAYVVFLVLLAVYVAIMAQRLRRVERIAEQLEHPLREAEAEERTTS